MSLRPGRRHAHIQPALSRAHQRCSRTPVSAPPPSPIMDGARMAASTTTVGVRCAAFSGDPPDMRTRCVRRGYVYTKTSHAQAWRGGAGKYGAPQTRADRTMRM